MLIFSGSSKLSRIVVLNPKGGSGKSTLSFNCAGYLASRGRRVALVDMDVQGSSLRWLSNRPASLEPILGIKGTDFPVNRKGDRVVRIPGEIDCAVIDAPARLRSRDLVDYTAGAHAILVPVLPSDLDIHAASRLVSELLLDAGVSRRNGRLGVVANRVNQRTIAYSKLMTFLDRLSIAVVGTLRQSQNYVHSAAFGRSIREMPESRVGKDLEQWQSITTWLEERLARPITPRDLLRPSDDSQAEKDPVGFGAIVGKRAPIAAAAGIAAAAMALYMLAGPVGDDPGIVGQEQPGSDILAGTVPAPELADINEYQSAIEPVIGDEDTGNASLVLRDKWQVSGIVHAGKSSVLLVKERNGSETHQVGVNGEFDGWTVTQMGEDFAVLAQNGEEVRLLLSEESTRQAVAR
jgi:chromosome partitioning protein